MELLKQLCNVFAPSGDEGLMTSFILDYVEKHKSSWSVQPQIFAGNEFRDNIVLVFGDKPTTAIFSHTDSIGFTVRYGRELVKVGGPRTDKAYELVGKDSKGDILCELNPSADGKNLTYDFERDIDTGTDLVFKCDFRQSDEYVQSCYLDNRLGCWVALKTAETLENGIIVFSTNEEHSGGEVQFLGKFIYENYGVRQALISDITWITKGVRHGKGVAISLRDRMIPRKKFINKVIDIAQKNDIKYQLEVEDAGGSDGHELQKSSQPFDWCFIGAAENNVHTPDEKVHKDDIEEMLKFYKVLMQEL